ncbi:Tubulin-tyrosine ligase family protein, partial [Opisthorchis viverrini]
MNQNKTLDMTVTTEDRRWSRKSNKIRKHGKMTENKSSVVRKRFTRELTKRLTRLALERCAQKSPDAGGVQKQKDETTGIDLVVVPDAPKMIDRPQQALRLRETSQVVIGNRSFAKNQENMQNEIKNLKKVSEGVLNNSDEQKNLLDLSINQPSGDFYRNWNISSLKGPLTPQSGDTEYFEELYSEDSRGVRNEASNNLDEKELDCLDDDEPGMEEAESLTEVSNSEASIQDQPKGVAPVIASLFPNTPSVLRFVGDGQTGKPVNAQLSNIVLVATFIKLSKPYRDRLKWRPSLITPNVVKRALRRSHFMLTMKSSEWLGYFGNHLKPLGFRPIKEYQKVNHFPGSFQLGRKDKLWINLNQLRSHFGRRAVDFVPRTFCLPADTRQLREMLMRQERANHDGSANILGDAVVPRWIIKPPASARGIGVHVVQNITDLPKSRQIIVQSYISRPFLINNTKFDLRLYVYVTCFNPFKAYLHREGLVRFASQQYSLSAVDINNRFVHLTNYSVNRHNKHGTTGVQNNKWKLETLWRYLLDRGVNVDGLWMQLKDIVFKTLASVINPISILVDQNCRRRACAHELFGFDILLDENLKPWLLEVNVSPSLHTNTKLDNEVKAEVVTDMLNIAGFRLPPELRTRPTVISDETGLIRGPILDVRASSKANGDSQNVARKYTRNVRMAKEFKRIPISAQSYQEEQSGKAQTEQEKGLNLRAFLPISDPRLWDVSLSWDERQKHLFHSRLACAEHAKQRIANPSIKLSGAQTNKTTRVVENSQKQRRNTLAKICKPVETTFKQELDGLLSYLTPDDVRTLVDFIDERYRVGMGNFEPIFPVAGNRGLKLLLFLQGCSGDAYVGQLGMRTPTFRYYDLLQYAFLTCYRRPDAEEPNFIKTIPLDVATTVRLPDYHILTNGGEMSADALEVASQITEINTNGLEWIRNLCKSGYHLAGSGTGSLRTPWNQAHPRTGPSNPYPGAPYRVGQTVSSVVGKVTSAVGRKTRVKDDGDTVDSILGGAVYFRAQSATPNTVDRSGHSTGNIQRDLKTPRLEECNCANNLRWKGTRHSRASIHHSAPLSKSSSLSVSRCASRRGSVPSNYVERQSTLHNHCTSFSSIGLSQKARQMDPKCTAQGAGFERLQEQGLIKTKNVSQTKAGSKSVHEMAKQQLKQRKLMEPSPAHSTRS